jgi:hypothetical protein
MTFNPLDGSLSGVPEQEGTYDFELTVSAGNGQSASESCTVDVGPAMTIALEDLGGPCIGPEDDLAALIVGGDGSPPTCSTPGGTGAGSRPEGVEVDPETCTIAGTSSDTYGTWVWVTAVEQSGYRQYVPYCYRQDTPAEGAYTVSGVHGEGTLGALDPAVATFTPGEPLDWGGGGDPLFSVEGPCGPTTCYFGFVFQVSSSGFGGCDTPPCYGLGPTEVINPRGAPIGYTHNLFAKGPPVPEDLQDRPWVLNWELRYCLASDPVTCNGSENIVENGEGALRFGVIMQPAR